MNVAVELITICLILVLPNARFRRRYATRKHFAALQSLKRLAKVKRRYANAETFRELSSR